MLLLSAQKPACSSAGVSAQVPWTCMGRDKTFPSSPNLPVMDVIADVNTASLGGYPHNTRARWAEGFHDELNGHEFDLERDGLRQVVLCL